MKISNLLFWIIWLLSLVFLVITSNSYTNIILFSVILGLVGILMYSYQKQNKLINDLEIMLKNIDFKPLEQEVKKINKERVGFYSKLFSIEDNLDEYKKDREGKYRDVVKKVLEIDNKLNKKFKLIGEAVVKLKNEIKKI